MVSLPAVSLLHDLDERVIANGLKLLPAGPPTSLNSRFSRHSHPRSGEQVFYILGFSGFGLKYPRRA